jgi:hypothetical protein
MVEYALTKDAREKASPGKPAKIVVRLNETTVLTLTRASVEIGDDMCTWHGNDSRHGHARPPHDRRRRIGTIHRYGTMAACTR